MNILKDAHDKPEALGRAREMMERQVVHMVRLIDDLLDVSRISRGKLELESIFEMFSQVDKRLERSQGGLGIGLTLAKRLVELHGGSIEAFSAGLGKGSELVVRLPAVIEKPQPQPPEGQAEEPAATNRRRILVVDDNQDSVESLAMLLTLKGNEAHTASNGHEAVEAAARLRPDVILLDIGMPDMNGYEACRRIREQSGGDEVIIIALTGWGQDEDRRRSSEAGFNEHLVKPVDPAVLMKLLAATA